MLTEVSLTQIKDPLHVRYVLGIKIPLNESVNLSNPVLLKEIVEKQLLFENFLDSLKKYLGDSYDKIVNVIKSPFDIAILIKNLVTNPKLLESILNTYKSKIEGYKKKFEETLLSVSNEIKKIIEKIKSVPKELFQKAGISLEKIIDFYEKVVTKIAQYFKSTVDFIQSKIGDGWLGLLKTIVSTGVLGYVSDKISFYIKKLTGITKVINDPKKFVEEIVDGKAKDNVDELGDGLDSSVKDVFNGLDGVKDTLESIMSFFKDIVKGKNWLWKYVVEYLSKIADYIKDKIVKVKNFDLTRYGKLEKGMKTIQDNYLRNLINKNILQLNEMINQTYIVNTWINNKITDVKTFDDIKDARNYIETLDAELKPYKMLPKKKYYEFKAVSKNITSEQHIYNKKKNMSNIDKIIKQGLDNLLETKGFEDMEVAFGVKYKSDNLSDAEKNQFGPMGQLKTSKGGSFPNPKVPGTKEVEKANLKGGKDAQDYYKEVAKKVKAYQTPNDAEKFEAPKVPTNTDGENQRLKTTGYDVGVSGMEVVADKAEKEGGSEMDKKKYKERNEKLNGNDATAQKLKKNADKTNVMKYDKDARNGRPVKNSDSKQPEQPEKKNESIESDNVITEEMKLSTDVQKLYNYVQKFVLAKYPQLKEKIDLPVEKAQIIALFAKEFGIEASQLGRVKSLVDKSEKSGEQQEEQGQAEEQKENIFKVKGNLVSERQVLKLASKVPPRIKIDETKFSITDGENTYKLIWEGDIETGEPVITNIKNNQLVNEDIEKMKYLWGFKPKEDKKIVKEDAEETFKKMFRQVKGK